MISFQLLTAIQQLTTAFENTQMNILVSVNHQDQSKRAVFSAKIASRTITPAVTVLFTDNGLTITTVVYSDFDPLTGQNSKDFTFFSEYSLKTFNEYDFINSVKTFGIKNGYLGLDLGF